MLTIGDPIIINMNNPMNSYGGHWMALFRLHGYKMMVALGTIFILMQFIVNFSSFHHHFKRITDYNNQASSNTSFLAIAKKWESQDLEVKRIMLSKDYLTKSDELGISLNPPANNESSQDLCPLLPPKLGNVNPTTRHFV